MAAQFQCCDCHVWLSSDHAQVLFGKQVGRCQHCGKGLPVITHEEPYSFTKNGCEFTVMLAFEMARQVFAYAVFHDGKLVDTFDLNQLRAALGTTAPKDGIGLEEIDTLKQVLAQTSDAELWAKLVKA